MTTRLNDFRRSLLYSRISLEHTCRADTAFQPHKIVAKLKVVQFKQDSFVVTVNDPCPCGSGKKYRKCCRPRG